MINHSDIEIKERMFYPLYPHCKGRGFAFKQIISLASKIAVPLPILSNIGDNRLKIIRITD